MTFIPWAYNTHPHTFVTLILSYSNLFFTAVLETLWLFIPRMTMSKSIWPVYLSSSLWFNHFLEIVVIYFPLKHFKERSALVIFLKLLLLQIDNPTALSDFPDMSNTPKLWRLFILSPTLMCHSSNQCSSSLEDHGPSFPNSTMSKYQNLNIFNI